MSALRSVAEKDMAIIRSKRGQGSGAAGTAPGAAKAKYRKRSRATPPGKCHSCNIRETPEWRRGPDGARTLCNACGLHYAKLIRKRDKTMGAQGHADSPPIDLEMLRASTRLGEPSGPNPSSATNMHSSEDGFRDGGAGDMAEIQLQPVPVPVSAQRGTALAPQMGVAMQVHQWTPPVPPSGSSVHREEGGYELAAYSTSLMRSSNARGSPT
ncbi:GATA-domain-containing protein [Ramaria rubella]|nr:GATA-domain-containing protein [Ramaria rubella]